MKKILFLCMIFSKFLMGADISDTNISAAFSRLVNAQAIESATVGEPPGQPSEFFADFKMLLNTTDADKRFALLFEQAKTNEAKVYALLGLYETDKKRYFAAARSLNTLNQSVSVIQGCEIDKYDLIWAVQGVKSGKLKNWLDYK